MRVGVLGLGHWGANHVRVLSAARHVESVHVADLSPDRVAAAAAVVAGVIPCASASSLFRDVDAVVIATHPSSHCELTRQALLAGCHVLVEKPLALDAREVIDVGALARDLHRVLMVGHTFLFHPAVRSLQGALGRGDLGTLRRAESRRLNSGIYRDDCDVLWDLGPHDVSILNLLFGALPSSVTATGSASSDRGLADTAHMTLSYPGGARAAVDLSWRWPAKVRELSVFGTAGSAVFDDTDASAPLRFYDSPVTLPRQGDEQPGAGGLVQRFGGVRVPGVAAAEPLALEDQHFIDCVLTGTEPIAGAEHALQVVQTLHAASTSMSDHGREVHLEDALAGCPSSWSGAVSPAGHP